MIKPQAFQVRYITLQNLPYTFGEPQRANTAVGGVLSKGRLVWAQRPYDLGEHGGSAAAFVDDIGIISLDPRWLSGLES